MAFYRIYPSQSTYISYKNIYSNYGGDHILDLSTTSGLSANQNKTRLLLKYDVQNLTAQLTSSYNATLTLYNARNNKITDENFIIEIYPIIEQWNPGIGSLMYPITSASNYIQRTSIDNWSISGGTFSASPSATFLFKNGTENLTANISAFIEYWKTNPNYGLMIKFPDSIESLTSNYQNNKSFFSGNTHTIYKPHIDISYSEELIKDDRNNLHIGNNKVFIIDKNVSSTVYPGACYLTTDLYATSATSQLLFYFKPNMWYINFVNNNLQYDSGLWTILVNTASNYSVTSVITGQSNYTSFANDSSRIHANFIGKQVYNINESPIFRTRIYNYVHIGMGSVATTYYPSSAYLFFIENNTRKVCTQEIEMNYDVDGHFVKFQLQNLLPNFYYIPVIKIVDGYDNQEIIYREIPEAKFYIRKQTDIYA